MAAGDVVNYIIQAASGTHYYYQPAAGVEIIVTMCAGSFNGILFSLYDGSKFICMYRTLNTSETVVKMFLNNSIYLDMYQETGNPHNAGFTGLQIK